jgi:hypothetical protein
MQTEGVYSYLVGQVPENACPGKRYGGFVTMVKFESQLGVAKVSLLLVFILSLRIGSGINQKLGQLSTVV